MSDFRLFFAQGALKNSDETKSLGLILSLWGVTIKISSFNAHALCLSALS